ncbi:hypothetical protein GQ43DRAFT_435717 [Delitschia confertaspora ATCC 74209]|uniref:Small secreted protein n=1 Tax=Delitschia confertaspora ATCC 74209 TaxID=1513339 RepID=A0A9P4JGF9_9PLEO|nr:hypothetical protein GQ43DRAFT_435717 [Delitschia confertaspora ATCC 74209]
MHFSTSILLLLSLFASSTLASPVSSKRAAVLKKTSYANFQISDGVAGNALAEVMAKFPIDTAKLASIDPADAKILSHARETAEAAETDAFNPAIEAASGDAAAALQNGKIKNKVLKLQLEVMGLQIKQAQGQDVSEKLAEEQKKLDKNVQLDEGAKGEKAQGVNFSG